MIVHNSINVDSCVVCFVHQGPNEKSIYFNDGLGHYHKMIYIEEGQIDTYPTANGTIMPEDVNAPLSAGQLYDISNTKGKYVVGVTHEVGASMVMFNPVPLERELDIQILKDAQTINIDAADSRVTIVCTTRGSGVTVNDKSMNTMQFAAVRQGTQATLTLQQGAVCAIITG